MFLYLGNIGNEKCAMRHGMGILCFKALANQLRFEMHPSEGALYTFHITNHISMPTTAKKKMSEADIASLNQLILAQLQDLYWAEEKIVDSLPGDVVRNTFAYTQGAVKPNRVSCAEDDSQER